MLSAENDAVIDIVYDPCDQISIRVATDTAPRELAAIDSATELWRAVSNVKITRNAANTTRNATAADQTLEILFEDASLVFRGVYQDEIGNIIVNRRLADPDDLAITVAHELGHAFGLPHIDARPSVMNSGNLEVLPIPADIDALSERWGPCVREEQPSRASTMLDSGGTTRFKRD